MSALPTPPPFVESDTEEFWTATAAGKLLLKRCNNDGTVIWYPRSLCPVCHSTDTSWFEASGQGAVYSFTVSHRGEGPYREAAPYVLAYVELDEGPRLMTNIVDCEPGAVSIGQRVRVVFDDTGEGNALIRFAPA
jgi:uncharacterized OB-fold protein